MHKQRQGQHGFTLLEMSIALVIIGLLVGALLTGQTLLRQSQVGSIMSDMQRYVSAVQSFQQKYSALPGDMANATDYWGIAAGAAGNDATCYAAGSASATNTCSGNGDGQINASGTYTNETLRVWQHLANAGFITGAFTGTTGAAHVLGTNCPTSRVDSGGFGMAYAGTVYATGTVGDYTVAFDGSYGHRLYFGAYYANNVPVAAVLSGGEAQSIDNKFDDGKPALGNLRTWKNAAYSLTCASSTAATATYSTSTSKVCSLMFITGF